MISKDIGLLKTGKINFDDTKVKTNTSNKILF